MMMILCPSFRNRVYSFGSSVLKEEQGISKKEEAEEVEEDKKRRRERTRDDHKL